MADTGGSNPYQQDAVRYVEAIVRAFGGYKRRLVDYLQPAPGQRILDAGCGAGDDALALARLVGPAGSVTGLDVNPAMVAAARQRAAAAGVPADFVEGDLVALPFPDGAFDRTRADRVLQHLARPVDALRELLRVTAPGGLVVLADVDWTTLAVASDDAAQTARILARIAAAQAEPHAGLKLREWLRQAGAADVECQPDAVCTTDWPVARLAWGLEGYAKHAAESGAISAADAQGWLAEMEARHAAGNFLALMSGFFARGRKS